MKKQWILFILITCSFSCASQKKEIIAKSTIKLEGKNTNIRNFMEIDGYYCYSNYSETQDVSLMFLEDGTYFSLSVIDDFYSDDFKEYRKSPSTRVIDKKIIEFSYSGVYKIESDTLIAYRYIPGSFWTPWYITEYRYKIIDRNKLLPIYSKALLPPDDEYSIDPWLYKTSYLYFNPTDSLYPPDNRLKEKKWIWRHERDWKAYMERIKQEKKKRK